MGSCWKLHDKIAVQKMANTGEKFSKPVCPPFPPSNTRGRYTPRRRRPSLSRSATVTLGSLVDILLCRHRDNKQKYGRRTPCFVCIFVRRGPPGPSRRLCVQVGRRQRTPEGAVQLLRVGPPAGCSPAGPYSTSCSFFRMKSQPQFLP